MSPNNPLNVLRDHAIATDGQMMTPGLKAVEQMRALERAGFGIVSNETAGLVAFIVARRGIHETTLDQVLIDLGLASIEPYDPKVHTGGTPDMLPGERYLKYSDALQSVLFHGRAHISSITGKMQ